MPRGGPRRHADGSATVSNKISFRAPRAVGKFDFRYLRDDAEIPLGRSNVLGVYLSPSKVDETLAFLARRFDDDDNFSSAARQLVRVIEEIHGVLGHEILARMWRLVHGVIVDGLAISKKYITDGAKEVDKLEAKFLAGASSGDAHESNPVVLGKFDQLVWFTSHTVYTYVYVHCTALL